MKISKSEKITESTDDSFVSLPAADAAPEQGALEARDAQQLGRVGDEVREGVGHGAGEARGGGAVRGVGLRVHKILNVLGFYNEEMNFWSHNSGQ